MEQSLPQLVLPIKIERSSERLTSLGGLVVLEELARALGVWKEVDRVLQGPKSGRGYRPREFVQALVWMLHAGGRRLEDLRELGGGARGARAVGLGGGAGRRDGGGLVEKCLEPEAEEVILDVDATEIEAEKQEAQWTYNHVQGYIPLLGYVNG